MAHTRDRSVGALLSKLLAFSPIVGIFGHRQVGKTTLASRLSPSYWTLDDRETRRAIAKDPKAFLLRKGQRPPVIIDECQYEPDLFPALKEHVRTRKRPGQFVLTGSVRFTSRKAIRESLAGRISPLELYPLILSELEGVELPDTVPTLMALASFTSSTVDGLKRGVLLKKTQQVMEKYLTHGGLPGICFVREERLRRELLSALHALILDRDLRLIVETKLSMDTLMRWLQWIAANGWNAYSATQARNAVGISFPTQKNLLYALESIYLIRRIPIKGRSGVILLLEDQYEEVALSRGAYDRKEQLLSCFFRNARAQFHYRMGERVEFESYWTQSGARVPLVVRGAQGAALGFIAVAGAKPTLSQTRAADSFLRHEPQGKVVFLSGEPMKAAVLDPRVLHCAAAALL